MNNHCIDSFQDSDSRFKKLYCPFKNILKTEKMCLVTHKMTLIKTLVNHIYSCQLHVSILGNGYHNNNIQHTNFYCFVCVLSKI